MTRKFLLIAGVASLALAGPAYAERGGKNRDGAAQASSGEQKAQRPQRAERQQVQRAERPQRIERQRFQRAERPQRVERAERPQRIEHQRFQRAERPQRIERQSFQRAERAQRVERQSIQRAQRAQRVERQRIQRAERPQRIERQRFQQAERIERKRFQRAERPQRIERQHVERRMTERLARRALDRDTVRTFDRHERARAFPVRAAGNDRQLASLFRDRPMRQMKLRNDRQFITIGQRIDPVRYSADVPSFYRTRYYDTPDYYYRYDDDRGYLYRVDRDDNFVRAMIPLFGGYGIGDPWPSTYYSSYVPLGYQSYYYDTPDYYYRNDGYGIYRIDAGTQLISALVALLSGQQFGVGQVLPASYGAYNVPLAYRSTYYDRDDALYRYGDGFIYEVDPYSRRIDARYPIYGAGYDYMVGEPWPVAYPGYNVPMAYQPLYYDTPQYQYRYADGGIYQVDPTTQVIRALVALVSGQQFGVGQPMPVGYDSYNVPLAYRDQYYDTDDAWYRYANGNVYEVDPATGLIEESFPIYA
jgi:hypothetical protein